MRKKKKIVQSLVAGILSLGLCASVVPMGASAVTYDRYDVNHDGAVDISDVVYINQYLAGAFSVMSPTALDINQNKVIDRNDSFEILARCVGNSTSVEFIKLTDGLTPVQNIPDELLAESGEDVLFAEDDLFPSSDIAEPYVIAGSRTYYKYNCTKGTYTTYGLQPELKMQTSSLNADEPDSINSFSDGNYYRVNGEGMDGIVKLVDDSFYHGTGFIVSDHVIATAAHCVWSGEEGTKIPDGFVDNLEIQMCNTNGTVTTTKYTVKEIHIPKSYADNIASGAKDVNTIDSSVDYALITVSESLKGYTHFNLGVVSTDDINNMSEVPLHLSGFPQKVKSEVNPSNPVNVYTSIGEEYSGDKNSYEQKLYYTNKNWHGMSGGPVYTVTNVYQNGNYCERINTVIAINTAIVTSNCSVGPAMNSYMLAFYGVNPNISY